MNKNEGIKIDVASQEVVLIITGCIAPITNQSHLVLKDIEERHRQYIHSLLFYIKQTNFYNIIFCDNSSYVSHEQSVVEEMARKEGKTFEWLSYRGDMEKSAFYSNKGIGEDEILSYVIEHSQLINKSRTIVKITGRLILKNIEQIVENAQYGVTYFYRDLYGDVNHGVDTRFYVSDLLFFKSNLMDCFARLNNYELRLEDAYYYIMKGEYSLLPIYPRFEGMSSGNGRIYDSESELKLRILDVMCRCGVYNKYYSPIYYYFKSIRKIRKWQKSLLHS